MDTTVILEPKQVYGVLRYYPRNEAAELFVKLAKYKTLSPLDVKTIKALGYKIEFQQPALPDGHEVAGY